MRENPYAPPRANLLVQDPPDPARRPIAVWLVIIGISLCVPLFAQAVVKGLLTGRLTQGNLGGPIDFAVAMTWRLILVLGLAATAYGAFLRHQWTRWVGSLCILVLTTLFVIEPDTTVYEDDADRAGPEVLQHFAAPLVAAYWVYAYAFSAKARRYFARRRSAA